MLSKCPQGEPKFKTFGEEKNLPLGITDSDCGNEPAVFCVFLDFCMSWMGQYFREQGLDANILKMFKRFIPISP